MSAATTLQSRSFDDWLTRGADPGPEPIRNDAAIEHRARELAGEAFDSMLPRAMRYMAQETLANSLELMRIACRFDAGNSSCEQLTAAVRVIRDGFIANTWDDYIDDATREYDDEQAERQRWEVRE
jgi:hypothetical protein